MLGSRLRGGDVAIDVIDTGIGIPAEHQARIFEEFYQVRETRSSRAYAGMGLGLAIVASIAHEHGGTVSVANDIDEETYNTVGGYVLGRLGRRARVGDRCVGLAADHVEPGAAIGGRDRTAVTGAPPPQDRAAFCRTSIDARRAGRSGRRRSGGR